MYVDLRISCHHFLKVIGSSTYFPQSMKFSAIGRSAILPFAWCKLTSAFVLVWLSGMLTVTAQHIQTSQGLPHPEVYEAARTMDGRMWIGTRQGLAVWDGISMTTFDALNSVLTDPWVRYVQALPDESVLIGTRRSGLFMAGPGTAPPRPLLPGGSDCPDASDGPIHIYSISPLHAGRYLIGVRDDDPWIFRFGTGLCPLSMSGPPSILESMGKIAVATNISDSKLAVGSWDKGLFLGSIDLDRRTVSFHDSSFVPIPGDRIRDLAVDSTIPGHLLVATSGLGLVRVRLTDGKLTFATGMSDKKAWSFVQNPDGTVWVATFDGGVNLVNSDLHTLDTLRNDPSDPYSLPHDVVTHVFRDVFGMVWACTDDGVSRVQPRRFKQYMASGEILSATFDEETRVLWIGYGTSVEKIRLSDGTLLATVELGRDFPSRTGYNPTALSLTTRTGHVLVGTQRQGLYVISPDGVVRPVGDMPDGMGVSRMLFDASRGIVLVGLTDGTLAQFLWDGMTPQVHMLPFEPAGTPAEPLFTDSDGRLFSTHGLNGLFFDGERDSVHAAPAGVRINDVHVDADSQVWLATTEGVIGDSVRFSAMDGLIDEEVYSITTADPDRFWVSTPSGISLLDVSNGTVERIVQSHDHSRITFTNRKLIGMGDASVIALAIDSWFRIRLPAQPTPRPDPFVMSLDGANISADELRPPRGQSRIVVDASLRELLYPDETLLQATLSTRPEEVLTHRGNTMTAAWRGLDPADSPHVLTARAVSPDGTVQTRTLHVVLRPFIWQTTWFLGLCLAVFVSGVWGAARVIQYRRDREQREIQDALTHGREMERLRLARTLHDDPLQNVYGIRQRLELMQYSRAAGEDIDDMLSSTLHLASTTTNSLRTVVTDLRPEELDLDGLESALQSAVKTLIRTHPDVHVAVSLDDVDAVPKDHDVALYRIAQSAFGNILRHARASTITVSLAAHDTGYTFEVADDGGGFDDSVSALMLARQGHYGLLGMKEWASSVGAELVVLSRPGHGTRVQVSWNRPTSRWKRLNPFAS